MADLTLKAVLLGEDRSAGKTIKGVGAAADTTAGKLGKMSGKLGNLIGGDAGELLNKVSDGFNAGAESSGKYSKALLGTGTVAVGAGLAMQKMASGDIRAHAQLQAAVAATGKGYAGFGEDVDKLIGKQVKFGHTDGEVQDSLRILTQAYGDPKKALDQMGLATDLAAAKHISLAEAAGLVAKAHGGAGRVFKEFGVVVGKNKDGTKNYDGALTAMAGKLNGQASASVDNFAGKLSAARAWTENAASSLSEKFGPAVTMVGAGLTGAGALAELGAGKIVKGAASAVAGWAKAGAAFAAEKGRQLVGYAQMAAAAVMSGARTLGSLAATSAAWVVSTARMLAAKAAQLAVAAASKVMAAGQWLVNAALAANPIGLVIVALAALAVGLTYAYKHSETFRNVVNGAFRAVAETARWLWNSALAPVIRFILNGFASMVGGIAMFLHALGRIPGFGWAETAARKMDSAAQKAREMAAGIKSIPPHKSSSVSFNVRTFYTSSGTPTAGFTAQAAKTLSTISDYRAYAGGTSNAVRGLAIVGEDGPELMWMNGGEQVTNAQKTARMLGNRGAQVGGGIGGDGGRPTVVQFVLDGKVIQQSLIKVKRTNGGLALGLA